LRFNWNAGFAQDPYDMNKAYYGSQFVHVTHDKGASWEVISPDLTTNNPEHQKGDYGGLTLDVSGAEMYNSILTIAPSPVEKKTIWVGTDDGQVQLTIDGGATWKNLTAQVKGIPKEGWIAQIKASGYDAATAWMVVNNYRKGDYAPYLFKTEDYGKTWKRLADEHKVKGYALTFIQDPVEPNLVFLGTENGLWMSMDEGISWVQFKNGFPSVSTMDMTIQEPESALIVGTFGRAIWVLDDLLTLREIAGKRLKKGVTALPMNDAVQVKGLFINPPGNIWTGFHTTFEGENKVFQRTEIPFYISDQPDSTSVVKAEVFDSEKRMIKTLEAKKLDNGLNYLIWKLDEQAASFRRKGQGGDARGIAVLPGDYTIALTYGDFKDTTQVKVIPDPRFDMDPEIDQALYAFRKEIDNQVEVLAKQFHAIDDKKELLDKTTKLMEEKGFATDDSLVISVQKMTVALKELRAKGQIPRPERQVGAWQSFKASPYTQLQDVRRVARAQTTVLSEQHKKMLEQATQSIDTFSKEVDSFMKTQWQPFEMSLKNSALEGFLE
jgi:hypothetical protein